VSAKTANLVAVTKAALEAGIAVCRPGADFREIGAAIDAVARQSGYKVNRDFIGHGVGRAFHAAPWVLPFKNNERVGKMVEGQTFTIEPIMHMGSAQHKMWKDQWTAVSVDSSLSAQFEHTLLVTAHGVERLTAYE
jgi:methionyl aminopeptidase